MGKYKNYFLKKQKNNNKMSEKERSLPFSRSFPIILANHLLFNFERTRS